MDTKVIRVLAIAGSLRRTSSNGALVNAAAQLAPAGIDVSIYVGLDRLPAFNPDLDTETPPPAVEEFRAALQTCDAVLISSPEYAHGVPGALKNALDWVVGSGEFIDKPVAVINASKRAIHAWNSLHETLTVMSARVIPDASITVPLDGTVLNATDLASHPHLGALLKSALQHLVAQSKPSPPYGRQSSPRVAEDEARDSPPVKANP